MSSSLYGSSPATQGELGTSRDSMLIPRGRLTRAATQETPDDDDWEFESLNVDGAGYSAALLKTSLNRGRKLVESEATAAPLELDIEYNGNEGISEADCVHSREALIDALSNDIGEFSDILIRDELLDSSTLKDIPTVVLRQLTSLFVATIHTPILEHIVRGDLPEMYCAGAEDSNELTEAIDALEMEAERRRRRPAIYANYLVSKKGMSPTPRELSQVIEVMRGYMAEEDADHDLANKIDGCYQPIVDLSENKAGVRKYLNRDFERGGLPNDAVVAKTHIFCNALEHRLGQIPKDLWDLPLREPLCEFGYSIDPISRMRHHQDHRSSNYIMNLCVSACKTRFPKRYSIKNWIVYFIPHYILLEMAEILITIAGHGYVHDGCGFSHQHAGESVASGDKLSAQDWDDLSRWTYETINVKQRFEEMCAQHKSVEDAARAHSQWIKDAKESYRKQQEEKDALLVKMRAVLDGEGEYNMETYANRLEKGLAELKEMEMQRAARGKDMAENSGSHKDVNKDECVIM